MRGASPCRARARARRYCDLFLPRAELRETELGLGVERFALNAEDGVGGGFARGGDDAGASSRPDAARRGARRRSSSSSSFRRRRDGRGSRGDERAPRRAIATRARFPRARKRTLGPPRVDIIAQTALRCRISRALHFAKRPKGDFFFQKAYPGHRAVVRSPTLFVSRASVEVTSRDDSPPSRPGDECDSPGYRDARHFRARARDEHVRRVRSLCRGSRLPTHARALRSAEMRGPARPVPRGIPAERRRSRARSHLDAVLSSGMRLPATRRHAARTHLTSWALAYREAHVATLRSPDAPYPLRARRRNARAPSLLDTHDSHPAADVPRQRALLVAYHLWLATHPFGPHIPSPRERASHGLRA